MKKMSETIVFFGSGPVAARSLELLQNWCSVECVITKPQPSHHKKIFPVIEIAQKYELPIMTASNRSELDGLMGQANFTSRAGVLIDYGIIISQEVINKFALGIVNSHFSVLPQWRGPDPITAAIVSGQKQTGVSLMLLNDKMDEGSILAFSKYDLSPDITTPELTGELIEISNALLQRTLPVYLENKLLPQPQSVTNLAASYSRKLTKADGIIDWGKSAEQLEREVRAYIEWPKSHTQLGGVEVIITKAHAVPSKPIKARPGSIDIIKDARVIIVATGNGSLRIDSLKPTGKKEMSAKEFLAGYGNRLK